MRWPKYWSFSFSIIPSKEIPGLISFQMDWLDLLAVHIVKGFSLVNEADVFLEFSCLLYEPTNVGNLISAFSKPSCTSWKFSVHLLLKPSLKDFKHNLASMWNEHNCAVVWTFFGTALLQDWNENWPSPSGGHWWIFQICWHIGCSTLTTSSLVFYSNIYKSQTI